MLLLHVGKELVLDMKTIQLVEVIRSSVLRWFCERLKQLLLLCDIMGGTVLLVNELIDQVRVNLMDSALFQTIRQLHLADSGL